MRIPVNINFDFSAGALTHNFVAPAPVPLPPVPMFSVEMPATMMWITGFVTNANKFSNGLKPVMHKGQWIVLDGHDCGMLVLDITVPPANLWLPVMWPMSSRKVLFSSSTVKLNGTATACMGLGLPPLPMMTCGEPIGAPTALSLINLTNTVWVGITFLDLLAGLVTALVSMAADYICSEIGDPPEPFGGAVDALADQVAEKFMLSPSGLIKGAAATISGLVVSVIRDPSHPTLQVAAGIPLENMTLTVNLNPEGNQSTGTFQNNFMGVQQDTDGNTQLWGMPQ